MAGGVTYLPVRSGGSLTGFSATLSVNELVALIPSLTGLPLGRSKTEGLESHLSRTSESGTVPACGRQAYPKKGII